jgi:hypothetical protein
MTCAQQNVLPDFPCWKYRTEISYTQANGLKGAKIKCDSSEFSSWTTLVYNRVLHVVLPAYLNIFPCAIRLSQNQNQSQSYLMTDGQSVLVSGTHFRPLINVSFSLKLS